ncbi:MAG: hypothetical protein O2904_02945 [bacterium]|nr:hypothetical protein [bacterium]
MFDNRRFYALIHSQETGEYIPDSEVAYHCHSTVNHCFGVQGHYPKFEEMHGSSLLRARKELNIPFALKWYEERSAEHAQILAGFDDGSDDAIPFEKAGNFGPYYISGLNHRSAILKQRSMTPYFYAVKR